MTRKEITAKHGRLGDHGIRASWLSRLLLVGLFFLLGATLAGCLSLRPGEMAGPETGETNKGLAYFHYLEAQRCLMADDAAGAIRHYEEGLKNDPSSALMETELAALYQRLGENKKALEHVQMALKLDPKNQEAHFMLAGLHVGLNQLQEATAEYERILVLDPENREARLFLATLYAQQRNFPKAVRSIQELLRQEPKLTVGYYYLGRFYLEMDKLAEAKKEFYRVLSLDPEFVPAMFDLAATLERENKYPGAMQIYRRILKVQPKNSRAWMGIGRLLLAGRRHAEAHRIFLKVKDLEKNDPNATYQIGLVYLEQKYPDEAVKQFRQLLANHRFHNRAHYYMALALEEKGDLPGAAREYQQVEKDNSENYLSAQVRLAYIYFQQKQKDMAFRLLDDLRRLFPTREDIYLTISYFYEDDSLWDKAVAVLQEGVEKVPRPGELHFRLAGLYEKKKNREESISHIKKVLELEPNNPDALNFLGYTYADAGMHLDEAERMIRVALRAKPDSGHIIDSLGWVYFKKGQYNKAVVELERANRIMPQDATVAEHLGDAYHHCKRYQDALRLYRRALTLEGADLPELRMKIRKLEPAPGVPPR